MAINLKEFQKENWRECTELKVSKEQEKFVTPNWEAIIQSKFDDEFSTMCIYSNDIMVGFLMYYFQKDPQRLGLSSLMIDKRYQNKGYGKVALVETLKILKKKVGNIDFFAKVDTENSIAKKVCEDIGFKLTGKVISNEEVMVVSL